jgi:hypothetical protein
LTPVNKSYRRRGESMDGGGRQGKYRAFSAEEDRIERRVVI